MTPETIERAQPPDNDGRLLPGDYFTHTRSGIRFVCRAVTRHDYDGLVRVELEPAPEESPQT